MVEASGQGVVGLPQPVAELSHKDKSKQVEALPPPFSYIRVPTKMTSQKAIFISHAWGGVSDDILAHLVKRLKEENIAFILDKRDLSYRQSIQEFMIQLGKADMVIIILSNKYLKSEYCMFELIQIYKNENLRERIFPIVLDEVQISSSADRLEFVKFWENALIELQNKIKELNSLSFIEGITEDLNLYSEIRNNIARLTGILRDINTLNIQIHQDSDYKHLITAIKHRITPDQPEVKSPPPVPLPKSDQPVVSQKQEPPAESPPDKISPLKAGHAQEARNKVARSKAARSKQIEEQTARIIAQARVAQTPVEQTQLAKSKTPQSVDVKPKSTIFTPFNLRLAGVSLILLVGLLAVWQFLLKPKEPDFYFEGAQRDGVMTDSMGTILYTVLGGRLTDSIGNFQQDKYRMEDYESDQDLTESYPTGNTYSDPHKSTTTDRGNFQKQNQTTKIQEDEEEEPLTKYQNNYESTYRSDPGINVTEKKDPTPSEQIFVPIPSKEDPVEKVADDKSKTTSDPVVNEPPPVYKPIRNATFPKNTTVVAKNDIPLSSDDDVSYPRRVTFSMDRALFHSGNVAVPAGSTIVAKVKTAKKSEYKGRGSITLVFEYIQAPDGQKIPLQTDEFYLEGKNLAPYRIEANTIFNIKTSSSSTIKY